MPDFEVETIQGPISVLATLIVYMTFAFYACYHGEQKKKGEGLNDDVFGMLYLLLTLVAPMVTGIMSLVDAKQESIRLGAIMLVIIAAINLIMLPVFNYFEELKKKEENQKQQPPPPPPPVYNINGPSVPNQVNVF